MLQFLSMDPLQTHSKSKEVLDKDTLYPLFSILAVEALNVALLEATNNNVFHGIHIGKDKVHISHIQFAMMH